MSEIPQPDYETRRHETGAIAGYLDEITDLRHDLLQSETEDERSRAVRHVTELAQSLRELLREDYSEAVEADPHAALNAMELALQQEGHRI